MCHAFMGHSVHTLSLAAKNAEAIVFFARELWLIEIVVGSNKYVLQFIGYISQIRFFFKYVILNLISLEIYKNASDVLKYATLSNSTMGPIFDYWTFI